MSSNPDVVLQAQMIARLVRIRRAVDRLAALDYANKYGGSETVRRSLSGEDQEWIRKARYLRRQLRAVPDAPEQGSEDEYARVEGALIAACEPRMKQSEYQQLWNAYLMKQKLESIERFERIRIVFFQGGAPQ